MSRHSFLRVAAGAALGAVVLTPALSVSAQQPPRSEATPPPWRLQHVPLPPEIELVGGPTCTGTSFCLSIGYDNSGDGLLTTFDGGARWTYASPPPGLGSFTDISCFDADACVASIGPPNTLFLDPSRAATSTDAGRTWTVDSKMPKPSGTGFWAAVSCVSATTCYVLDVDAGSYTTGGIEKTTDLGKTWTSEHVSGTDASDVTNLVALACETATSCVAAQASTKDVGDLVFTTNGGTTWDVGQVPSGFKALLSHVSCVRSTTDCMAVGASGSTTAVLTSTDSGKSWKATSAPGYSGQLNGVSCPSESRCVAVGYLGSGLKNEGVAATSVDFGKSWHIAPRTDIHGNLDQVTCPSASVCIASRTSDGFVLPVAAGSVGWVTTKDGGATWSAVDVPLGISAIQDISCVTTLVCTAVGGVSGSVDAGVILRTDNGGATWTEQHLVPGLQSLSSVSCATTQACVAAGSFNLGTGDLITYTQDGGRNWVTVKPPSLAAMLLDVDCPSSMVCEILGRTAGDAGDAVLRTTDGGAEWTASRGPAFLDYGFRLSCPTTETCFLVGDDATNGGAIYVTTDGGLKWTEDVLPPSASIIQSVSCPTVAACYAWSSGDVLTTTDGGAHWSSKAVSQQPIAISEALSCAGPTTCSAVVGTNPFGGPTLAYTTITSGKTWEQPKMPAGVGWLVGIDCKASVCFAVGIDGQIVRGTV